MRVLESIDTGENKGKGKDGKDRRNEEHLMRKKEH